MRTSRIVAALAIVAVLVAVIVVVTSGDAEAPPGTFVLPSTTTTTGASATVPSTGSTTTEATTTTTSDPDARVAEVEALLRQLWFGWFDAIYRKDAEALWNVVATQQKHDEGVAAFATLTFDDIPAIEGITVDIVEILADRPDCLVVFQEVDVTAFRTPGMGSTVTVLWPGRDGNWRLASAWKNPRDLWTRDCDALSRPEDP